MFFPSSEDLMFLVITSLKCVFVKGVGKIYKFWGLQGIMDKNRPLDNWGFKFWIIVEFCFVILIDGDLGIA